MGRPLSRLDVLTARQLETTREVMSMGFALDFEREAERPGHVCGTFNRPCIHHDSYHCLACCIRDKRKALGLTS